MRSVRLNLLILENNIFLLLKADLKNEILEDDLKCFRLEDDLKFFKINFEFSLTIFINVIKTHFDKLLFKNLFLEDDLKIIWLEDKLNFVKQFFVQLDYNVSKQSF